MKKILYLLIFALLLLKPNYGKAQCAPAGTQEFTGQMKQNGTYKISSNQYAKQIPSQIPSGVTLYITGTADIPSKDIRLATKVQVCNGGTFSTGIYDKRVQFNNLTIGPSGAVSVNIDGPSNISGSTFGSIKENSILSVCTTGAVNLNMSNWTTYTGSDNGKSYVIVGGDYSLNTSNAYVSNKQNVTLIDFLRKYWAQNAPPRSYGDSYRVDETYTTSTLSSPAPFSSSTACNARASLTALNPPTDQTGTIQVTVSEDTNGDTIAESALEGVTVGLYQGSSTTASQTANTDASGNVTFTNLTPGTYTVRETDPTGYISIWDNEGEPTDNSVQVTVTGGNTANAQFVDRSDKLVCNPVGAKGQGEFLSSVVGISTLDRGNDTSWLNSVKNGQLVLDSKEKGLVIPRIANPSNVASPLKDGMIIYDTTDNCIKLYQNNKWGCLTRKNCITSP